MPTAVCPRPGLPEAGRRTESAELVVPVADPAEDGRSGSCYPMSMGQTLAAGRGTAGSTG